MTKGIGRGVSSALTGLREASRNASLKKAYAFIALGLSLLSLFVLVGGLALLVHFTPMSGEQSTLTRVGLWALRIFGGLAWTLATPILSIGLMNLLFPVFSEIPFLAGMRAIAPERARELESARGFPLWIVVGWNARRLFVHLLGFVVCFALGFIPLLGAFVAPVLQFLLAARLIGWELLDPYFDKRGLDWAQQKSALAAHRGECFGFGAVNALVLAIPLVGPLFFGVLQAGAARFVLDVFEPDVKRVA